MLETFCAMQEETKECYVVDGEAKTCNELLKMGYTSSSYRQVPKKNMVTRRLLHLLFQYAQLRAAAE